MCLLTAATLCLAAYVAEAEQVAPQPIEPGEWYIGASAGVERVAGSRFRALELYKDDSEQAGNGKVTLVDPEGYLINHRIEAEEFIPEIHIGYGLKSSSKRNLFTRIELSTEGFNRSEGRFTAISTPALSGYFVGNTTPPPATVEVGLDARYGPIDGQGNADDDASFMFGGVTGSVVDERFELKEYSRAATVSAYIDSQSGPWLFTRGISITYGYLYQKINHEYFHPGLLGVGGLGLEKEDVGYFFQYRNTSHSGGAKFNYSIGYEILDGLSIFTLGRVTLLGMQSTLKGTQNAPCLTVCDITGDVADYVLTRGSRSHRESDLHFAYDARFGLGVSARLGPVRLTAQGGGTRVSGWPGSRETERGVRLSYSDAWGYFATTGVDLAF
jgi:hypothetical protein